jgi:hypothetical protein
MREVVNQKDNLESELASKHKRRRLRRETHKVPEQSSMNHSHRIQGQANTICFAIPRLNLQTSILFKLVDVFL